MSFGILKIVCFMCNWAFCNEKELAINQEQRIPCDANIVRIMCIGRIDPVVILETFRRGADGVLLVGCTPPDCHFVEGNLYAERTIKLLKELLSFTGLEPGRLELRWSSATEEVELGQVLDDFAAKIQKFGVSPLAGEIPDEKVLLNVSAAKNAAAGFVLRTLAGREKELAKNVNVYGEKISQEEFNALIGEIVEAEFIRHKIHLLTKQKPLSVRELAAIIGMKPTLVLRHIVNMRRDGMITLDRFEETTPLYKALEVR